MTASEVAVRLKATWENGAWHSGSPLFALRKSCPEHSALPPPQGSLPAGLPKATCPPPGAARHTAVPERCTWGCGDCATTCHAAMPTERSGRGSFAGVVPPSCRSDVRPLVLRNRERIRSQAPVRTAKHRTQWSGGQYRRRRGPRLSIWIFLSVTWRICTSPLWSGGPRRQGQRGASNREHRSSLEPGSAGALQMRPGQVKKGGQVPAQPGIGRGANFIGD